MATHYPRQTIVAPAGLITEPNEYGQYPAGALKLATNVVMRNPGKLSQAPSFSTQTTLGTKGQLMKLMPANSGAVYALVKDDPTADNWKIYADAVSESFLGSTTNAFSKTGRISWAECNDRILVNGKFGILVRDPGAAGSPAWRAAGLLQPNLTSVFSNADPAGWLKVNQMVGYRVCFVRRYGDDYTLRSAPSVVFKTFSSAGGPNYMPIVTVGWPANSGLLVGDIIEIYRTDILDNTVATADPGSTFKLVMQYALTSVNLFNPAVAGSLDLTDYQPPIPGGLRTPGRELYTNPGVEGETYGNLRPPIAQCLASFKGFCFYGNTSERAQLKFNVPWGLGLLPATGTQRSNGIGRRQGAGTVTSGSKIITAVPDPDEVGIVVGQLWGGATNVFPASATVTAVNATQITMSVNATANTTGWALDDAIEIGGVTYHASSLQSLLIQLGGVMEARADQALINLASVLPAFEVTLMWNLHPFDRPITVRATNGANYSPPLPEIGATVKTIDPIVKKNRLTWSKEQQPEHCPSVSETFVGFGEIYATNPTRDALWIWCSDGLFRLSGNGGAQGLGAWQVDYANATLLLSAPQASAVYEEHLYAYTSLGCVEVDTAGNVRNLTAGVIGNLLPGTRYRETPAIFCERNERDGEIALCVSLSTAALPWVQAFYLYNVQEKAWTFIDRPSVDAALNTWLLTCFAMQRVPANQNLEAQFLIGGGDVNLYPKASYGTWNADSNPAFVSGTVQYQPVYGEDPLELKRWMWCDYLFDANSVGDFVVLWNGNTYGGGTPITMEKLDVSNYARAGVPREVGLSHSLSPGFLWLRTSTQRKFEGISLAVRQRTNQSKKR